MRADQPEEPPPWSSVDLRRPPHAALFLLPLTTLWNLDRLDRGAARARP